tara:strand:- start:48 stop:314 length:267 start_codon:yes stop_codon:yes gene_type:complete
MARPKPKVLHTMEVGDGTTWEILEAEAYYAITYDGRPIGIRITQGSMTNNGHLYKKMSYTNLGNARAQMARLNHRFKTTGFDVMMIEV